MWFEESSFRGIENTFQRLQITASFLSQQHKATSQSLTLTAQKQHHKTIWFEVNAPNNLNPAVLLHEPHSVNIPQRIPWLSGRNKKLIKFAS